MSITFMYDRYYNYFSNNKHFNLDRDFQGYYARVQALSSTSPVQPFKRGYSLFRRGRVGTSPVQVPLWDDEYITYYHRRVSVQTPRLFITSSYRLRPYFIILPPFAWSAQSFLLPPRFPSNGSVPDSPRGSVALGVSAGRPALCLGILTNCPSARTYLPAETSCPFWRTSSQLLLPFLHRTEPSLRTCSPLQRRFRCDHQRSLFSRLDHHLKAQPLFRYAPQVKILSPS